jgi:hypothetical protein
MYLKELGFDEDRINMMERNIPELAKQMIEEQESTVTKNINYLKELGVTNYVDAFTKFYNMFLLSNDEFESIFSKYDREDLVEKLQNNIAIMEYL